MVTEPALPGADQVAAAVRLLSAMAHPARLVTLLALSARAGLSVGDLQEVTGLEQSALSHQLRVLREARLVVAARRGRLRVYSLADHHVAHIVRDAVLHAGEPPGGSA